MITERGDKNMQDNEKRIVQEDVYRPFGDDCARLSWEDFKKYADNFVEKEKWKIIEKYPDANDFYFKLLPDEVIYDSDKISGFILYIKFSHLETDNELKDRLDRAFVAKNNRYNNYLKLKEEFEIKEVTDSRSERKRSGSWNDFDYTDNCG